MKRKVILTPIAKKKHRVGSEKPDSRRDYEEQERLTNEGEPWMWDDASSNLAQVGDVNVFVHNNSYVNVHRVTAVQSVDNRVLSWANRPSRNIGHYNRQILYLSPEIGRLTWNEWQKCGGYKVQCTMYVKNKELKDCLLYLF